ncbi:MAG: hypothetical protein K0V04_24615 [Deltaproteobacteria bacterium]|nr:hypothetical protein [Deltaproteobacteria bacterium]
MDETKKASPSYRLGVACGFALAVVVILAWQAFEHGQHSGLYTEFGGIVLPTSTTIVLSPVYRIGMPTLLLMAILVAHDRRAPWLAIAAVVVGMGAVVFAYWAVTAPMRALTDPILGS